ncbi:MAG: hypothetical protein OXH37_11655 [Gammaproteobacteria bacterium]|nr:hypothetical protein [Gammaproteobacteria bacterium]
MASLLLVAAVAAIAFIWLRGTQRNRLAWLKKLNLPGQWRSDSGVMTLEGDVDGGQYRLVEGTLREQGRWSLNGNQLQLAPDSDEKPKRLDLRYFDPGKIGIDGPGLRARIYRRETDNVVPLKTSR